MTDADTDKAAWVREAMAKHEQALLRYAASLTGDPDTARDIVQDTFLRMWRARPGRLGDGLTAWLYTVCRNRALDVRRKELSMGRLQDAPVAALSNLAPDPSALAELSDSHREALEVLKTLPASQQEVVRLRFQGELSYKEISAVTGHSVSNVGYMLHVALAAVRESVRAVAPEGHAPERSL